MSINEKLNKIKKLMLIENINGEITYINRNFLIDIKKEIINSLNIKESDLEEVIYDEFTFGIKIPFDKITIEKHNELVNLLEANSEEFLNSEINGDKNNITYNFKHKDLKEGEVLIPTSDGTQSTASATEKMSAEKELKDGNTVKFIKK
jgi:hypothetical protein